MKYKIIDDRYLEFVDRWGNLVRVDLDRYGKTWALEKRELE